MSRTPIKVRVASTAPFANFVEQLALVSRRWMSCSVCMMGNKIYLAHVRNGLRTFVLFVIGLWTVRKSQWRLYMFVGHPITIIKY